MSESIIPHDAKGREEFPVATGCFDYFTDALAAVANLSWVATQQHHPGEEMHWQRNKSTDHANKLLRHLKDRGKIDTDGMRHSAKVAWRALALLQEELEKELGLAPSRASRGPRVWDKIVQVNHLVPTGTTEEPPVGGNSTRCTCPAKCAIHLNDLAPASSGGQGSFAAPSQCAGDHCDGRCGAEAGDMCMWLRFSGGSSATG